MRTATLRVQAQNLPVTVRLFDRVAFVPLAALADLPGAQVRLVSGAARGVELGVAGRTAVFPVNVARLLSLQSGAEFAVDTR